MVRENCGLLGGMEQPSHTLCMHTSSGDLVQGQVLTPQAWAGTPDAVSLRSPRGTVTLRVHRPQGSRVAAGEFPEDPELLFRGGRRRHFTSLQLRLDQRRTQLSFRGMLLNNEVGPGVAEMDILEKCGPGDLEATFR